MVPALIRFRTEHGDPAGWPTADFESYEVLSDLATRDDDGPQDHAPAPVLSPSVRAA